jgi:glycosyltransferase involved in cell wall biosynthesis
MDVFLTFLIITYRRPEKVVRLLELFLDDRWKQLDQRTLEIVIADDHSEDNTEALIQPLMERLREKGWILRYVYRDKNLRGDRNLYYGYIGDSLGKYVWFLCDDDIIYIENAISYIKIVKQTQPLVAICGFEQGDNNQFGNKFGGSPRLVSDYTESINYLIKFPKTTAYLMRRCPEVNLDILFEKLDKTLFSWIGLSIYLLSIKSKEKLLIYPEIVATADDDYSLLQYSYRIFGKLYFTTKFSIEYAGQSSNDILPNLKYLKHEDEILLNLNGLKAHYSRKTPIRYTQEVLEKEVKYFIKTLPLILISRTRFVALLKLIIYKFRNILN